MKVSYAVHYAKCGKIFVFGLTCYYSSLNNLAIFFFYPLSQSLSKETKYLES